MGISIELPSRAQRRRKVVARYYRGPDDKLGRRHTQTGRRPFRKSSFVRTGIHKPSENPAISNHERVTRQRELSRKKIADGRN